VIVQPLVVVTAWGTRGVAPLVLLFVAASVASIFYRRALQRRQALSLRAVLLLSAAGLALAWCAPLLFSSDVYAYAAYGEMARLGLNPYAPAAPSASDVIVRAAELQWGTAFPICVYGPAFVAVARALVTLFAPFGLRAELEAFRAMASVAFLCCGALAYVAYQGDRTARLRAAATLALNPAAIWCAAEGHNDAIALAAVLAGYAVMRRRLNLGSAIVALSALVKLPGIVAAAALAVVHRRARPGAIAGIAIAFALSVPFFTGIATRIAPHGTYAPQASLQAVFAPVSPLLAAIVAVIASACLAARGIALLRESSTVGWIWLGVAAWVLVPNPYPWYGIWLVALAALAPQSRAGAVAILLSLTSMLRYVPDAIATPSPPLAAMLGLAATLPLLGLLLL
jgi:hypothetical protein